MGYEDWHNGINTGYGHSAQGGDQNLGKKEQKKEKGKIPIKKQPKSPSKKTPNTPV